MQEVSGDNEVNRASSRVDSGYTELFSIASVTSRSVENCNSVLGATLEFCHASQGSLHD